jgi:hypothetical protein
LQLAHGIASFILRSVSCVVIAICMVSTFYVTVDSVIVLYGPICFKTVCNIITVNVETHHLLMLRRMSEDLCLEAGFVLLGVPVPQTEIMLRQ